MIRIKDIFKNDWDWIIDQDIRLKSNSEKRIIELETSETDEDRNSTLLIMYNYFSEYPLIVIENTDDADLTPMNVDNYDVVDSGVGVKNGKTYREFTYTYKGIRDALQ